MTKMKKFAALIAVVVASALGAPTVAKAQQPVTIVQSAPVVDTSTVYGWVDGSGRVIPYQTYSVPSQPVYSTGYYYSPCNTVYYSRPTYYYSSCYSSCWSPCYSSCWSSRRYHRWCR
jgi:hypothetical protein